MMLHINRISYPVVTLGPGRRMALWVQGCARQCPGCASVDTWDFEAGRTLEVSELAEVLANVCEQHHLDGLSITGGEPAEQAEGLSALIEMLRMRIKAQPRSSNFDVLVFTGYPWKQVCAYAPLLVDKVDAMVCGPYEETRPRANRLCASDNQELVILNDKVRQRFEEYASSSEKTLQFDVGATGMSLVGMPEAGDLKRLEDALAKRGVELGGVSWRR